MTGSQLSREIAEIPDAAARLLEQGGGPIGDVAKALRKLSPMAMITVARGSSDHVATSMSYGLGQISGIIPASYPPSLASLTGQAPNVAGQVALAISQSGQSKDIIAGARALSDGGAHLVVLTNSVDGPLAHLGGDVIDIHAGPEMAVAATKSFVNSLLAGAMLIAEWQDDASLRNALSVMPDALARALGTTPDQLVEPLASTSRLMVLGRGPSLGIANEIALKAMELCGVPALAYSAAEVRHGPMQILRDDFPLLDLSRGQVLAGTTPIPLADYRSVHPLLDPLLDLVPVYVALEAAARARGLDPDAPDRLKKETVTI